MVDPVLILPLAWSLAAFWAVSASHKLTELQWFQSVLNAYNVFPNWAIKPLSLCVVAAEVLIAIALLFVPIWGALASIALLFAYALLLGFNALRGQDLKDCGCSWGAHNTSDEPQSVAPFIIRNLGLIFLAALILIPKSGRELTAFDWLNVGLASICVLGLGITFAHLSSNYSRMKAYGHV